MGAGLRIARRNALVERYQGLVAAIARECFSHVPLEIEEIVCLGNIGLIDAASRFDATRGSGFASFAGFRIKGAIRDGLRKLDWMSRDTRRFAVKVARVTHALLAEGATVTDEAIAAKMEMPLSSFRRCRLAVVTHLPMSIEQECQSSGHPLQIEDTCSNVSFRDVLSGELKSILDRAIEFLPPRHAQVLDLYYNRELTMREIGTQMEVNESRVSQIHSAALLKLREWMNLRCLSVSELTL